MASIHDSGGRRAETISRVALLLVVLSATMRHFHALGAPFFADDFLFLDQTRGQSFLGALASHDPIGNFLRPVSRPVFFWLVTHLGGESPFTFHVVNLGLWLTSIGVLFWIVRRVAGEVAATVAAGFLALQYAADVPLLWCSGDQDLLALLGSLGALAFYLHGSRLWAALALALALLSKETVCLVPIVAVVLSRRRDESLSASARRAWPLFAVPCAWAVLWFATASARSVPTPASLLRADAVTGPFVHLAQVSLGLEIGRFHNPISGLVTGILAVAAAACAVALVVRSSNPADHNGVSQTARPTLAGIVWALCGAVPIVAVASTWSAYFYLFALCGIGLAVGSIVSRSQGRYALPVFAVLGVMSVFSSANDDIALTQRAWGWRSHVNRAYIERANSLTAHYLAELRRLHPDLPHNSTVFLAGVPAFTGFQAGDGALLRHVYNDVSIRSRFLSDFALDAAKRGPCFFIYAEDGGLRDHTTDPNVLTNFAYTMLVSNRLAPAIDALRLQVNQQPRDQRSWYWLAWLQWSRQDTTAAKQSLLRGGVTPVRGSSPQVGIAESAISRKDTVTAIRLLSAARRDHGLDASVHAKLAPLLLLDPSTRADGVVEAFARTALDSADARGWRMLGVGQLLERQYAPALTSLERYTRTGGRSAAQDQEARAIVEMLRRRLAQHDAGAISVGDLAGSDVLAP